MAEVVAPEFQSERMRGMASSRGGPVITMVPNPDFTFPIRPQQSEPGHQPITSSPTRRPASASMHIDIPRSEPAPAHRRAVSTLPSFSFNATDSSGRADNETPPQTPDDTVAVTPVRRGHRRGGSEFVGGDSRFGVANAVSASPTKGVTPSEAMALSTAPPNGRRGHSHRRSAAISSQDVSKLMQSAIDVQPRLSSSLPSTPLEQPADLPLGKSVTSLELDRDDSDPFGAPLDTAAIRPPSRPRVGFSENVEFIPRPLSTISSETESSLSTIRGHSVNNSISSVLSLGSPNPQSPRTPRTYLRATREDEVVQNVESPTTTGRRVEREGQWLRRRSSDSLKRPKSESAVSHPRATFAEPDLVTRPRKRALSHALGLDRRRSEPNMSASPTAPSRLSTISLQEQAVDDSYLDELSDKRAFDPKTSAKRIRDWAASKITKITKESDRPITTASSVRSVQPTSSEDTPGHFQAPLPAPAVAETDLDAVFGSQERAGDSPLPTPPAQPRFESNNCPISTWTPARQVDYDDLDTMLDLDAALGPFKTPALSSYKQRKELHSSRLNRDFIGPGGHYQRRSDSEPTLPPYECARDAPRSQSAMADVFEEDEEDSADVTNQLGLFKSNLEYGQEADDIEKRTTTISTSDATSAKTNHVEDLDSRGNQELDQEVIYYCGGGAVRPIGLFGEHASYALDGTASHEVSFGDEVEIVDADEEPRASSQTKSSDSSDTPTILADPISTLTVPDGQRSLTTPDTYQTSTFSSPALRPTSFENHRLDTAASSIADNRTISSCNTGELGQDLRISQDVPSLTSSRSTMISSVPGNNSRRDFSAADRTMSVTSTTADSVVSERRRKRSSIQSLSQLVGSSFGAKSRGLSDSRPQSSSEAGTIQAPKKEHRLKKLMFWKSKHNSNQHVRHGP